MYKNKSILAVIPARGGSKGVPRKNVRVIAGKPLIAWTIEAAKKSKYIDRIILSSDDAEIIDIARQWNCEAPFVRPAELARDGTPGTEPVLHALGAIGEKFDYVVLLQPTSPLRRAEDIDGCIKKCISLNVPACVTVTVPDKNPYWMFSLDNRHRLRPVIKQNRPVLSRQQSGNVYALNGAVYVAKVSWFRKSGRFISDETIACDMSRERSIDVDTELDLKICGVLLSGA